MSTRCNVLIGDRQFYHHNDGYPGGVGADLAYWLANRRSHGATEEGLANELGYGIPGRLANTIYGRDESYEEEPADGLHWDIEYLYIVTSDGPHGARLFCVDVDRYLEENPAKGMKNVWDGRERHPFFRYKPSTYRKKFCDPEHEIALPSADVPPERQVYLLAATMDRAEAVRRGLGPDDDTPYGAYAGGGFFRVRNAKRKTVPKNAYRSGLYAARRYRP